MTLFGFQWERNKWLPTSPATPSSTSTSRPDSLAEVQPGKNVRVVGFCSGLSPSRYAHLLSYGLVPGSVVRVVQHSPVTIIQVDQLELALERDLAQEVQVAPVS